MVSEQWFVKMDDIAATALTAQKRGDFAVNPDRFSAVFTNWLDNIQDWCISRQLWWGHRIPVWYCFESEAAADAAGGRGDAWVVAADATEARAVVCSALPSPPTADALFAGG